MSKLLRFLGEYFFAREFLKRSKVHESLVREATDNKSDLERILKPITKARKNTVNLKIGWTIADGLAAYIDVNRGYPLFIVFTQLSRLYFTMESLKAVEKLDAFYEIGRKAFVEDLKEDNYGEEWKHLGYDTKLD